MLFITNRGLKQSKRSRRNRKIDFNLDDTEAQQSVFFCRRNGAGDYVELMSGPFLRELRDNDAKQVFLYIHGFNNLPEDAIFPRAQRLQAMFDAVEPKLVQVIPLIWPCDSDGSIISAYWDDQKAADASAHAFARLFGLFMKWRRECDEGDEPPCLKRINVLAHSMGNRVLRETLKTIATYDHTEGVPLLFRNSFMAAADVVNEALERDQPGRHITEASRNVVVYFASDDLALRASKGANLRHRIASRRLGHTGPEDMRKVPDNVYAVDCDDFNTDYDMPKGHSYFLNDDDGNPGAVFEHLLACIQTGRVPISGHDGSQSGRL